MRILKKIMSVMAVCAVSVAGGHLLHAETVSLKEAKSMAQKFFNESRSVVTPPVSYVYNGKDLTTHRLFTPFYVFNSPAGGFVVISAENKAFPILAFSRNGHFDKNKIPDDVRSVLKEFSRDVELIRYDCRIPTEAILQWSVFPEIAHEILKGSGNSDFYEAPFGDAGMSWMVRRSASEFDFENSQPVESDLPSAPTRSVDIPEPPIVVSNGGGHFSLSIPNNVERVVVYDISGAIVDHKTFRNTNVAHIDLASHPNGFYIALIIDNSGIQRAVKLYR